ncbi:igf2 mRNA binding [Brachionus plicatilis]|uniref:Igf2 mRNA binding n=1 Tax=Brachionus plicatilis TaxID=10195 RepID=A0A3M7RRK7_BRAPC|nr:igf2 mRNA binding [Brachionus plicatilis]
MYQLPHAQSANDIGNQTALETETVYLYIPNIAVGAIIGTKGSYIKNIIKLSGASVKITPMSAEESKTAVERQVVIQGSPESQWKAQYYIYDKIRQERFASDDNVKLRAEIQVPSSIVGRIIGKMGKNVRELQRTTGATIKLPEDVTQMHQNQEIKEQDGDKEANNANAENAQIAVSVESAASSTTLNDEDRQITGEQTDNSVTVRIYGSFQASQCAQRRIFSLVNQSSRGASAYNFTLHQLPPMPMSINHYLHAAPIHYGAQINHRDYMSHHQNQFLAQQHGHLTVSS